MYSLGVDAVEIKRFAHWNTRYNQKNLSHIFTAQEIEYCLKEPLKSAERFAGRFAAKEAYFKALSHCQIFSNSSFYTISKYIRVIKNGNGSCIINFDNSHILYTCCLPSLTCHLSITHTSTLAFAVVILSKKEMSNCQKDLIKLDNHSK